MMSLRVIIKSWSVRRRITEPSSAGPSRQLPFDRFRAGSYAIQFHNLHRLLLTHLSGVLLVDGSPNRGAFDGQRNFLFLGGRRIRLSPGRANFFELLPGANLEEQET